MGRDGGVVVSMLAFYLAIWVRISLKTTTFFCHILMEKNENKQKDATIDPFKKFKFPWATIERFVY